MINDRQSPYEFVNYKPSLDNMESMISNDDSNKLENELNYKLNI